MRPETAQLRSLSNPGGFDLLEQNFDFDLLTPAKLLEKYTGRTVRVIRTNPATGVETVESAQVLATTQGTVLQIGDRIETGVPGRIVFDGVPPNLRDRPTLVTELQNRVPGTQDVELTYLSGGLSWQADYVAELNAGDSALDLNGWVTLTNRSGTAYPRAKLQLVAGDVNRVRQELRRSNGVADAKLAMSAAASPMVQETLFEYHLYTLQRPTTLADNQTKQVALLNAAAVPVKKELLLNGADYYYRSSVGDIGQKLKTSVYVEFYERRELAPRPAAAEGRGPGLQARQLGQCPVRRRGPHRPHREEREGPTALGRGVRRDCRQAADRFPPPRTDQQGELRGRERLRDRAAQCEERGRDRDGARAGAGRLDHAGGIAAARQGRRRNGRMAGARAGERHDLAALSRARALLKASEGVATLVRPASRRARAARRLAACRPSA